MASVQPLILGSLTSENGFRKPVKGASKIYLYQPRNDITIVNQ